MPLNAIPQINRQTEIAGPQGVAPLAVIFGVSFTLFDGMRCKRSRSFEPFDVACPPIEFEKGVAIACCAMTQVRTLGQRSRLPR